MQKELVETSFVTCNIQSEFFISAKLICTIKQSVNDIDSWTC